MWRKPESVADEIEEQAKEDDDFEVYVNEDVESIAIHQSLGEVELEFSDGSRLRILATTTKRLRVRRA